MTSDNMATAKAKVQAVMQEELARVRAEVDKLKAEAVSANFEHRVQAATTKQLEGQLRGARQTIELLEQHADRLNSMGQTVSDRLDYALAFVPVGPDGVFTWPDGSELPAGSKAVDPGKATKREAELEAQLAAAKRNIDQMRSDGQALRKLYDEQAEELRQGCEQCALQRALIDDKTREVSASKEDVEELRAALDAKAEEASAHEAELTSIHNHLCSMGLTDTTKSVSDRYCALVASLMSTHNKLEVDLHKAKDAVKQARSAIDEDSHRARERFKEANSEGFRSAVALLVDAIEKALTGPLDFAPIINKQVNADNINKLLQAIITLRERAAPLSPVLIADAKAVDQMLAQQGYATSPSQPMSITDRLSLLVRDFKKSQMALTEITAKLNNAPKRKRHGATLEHS